MHPADANNHRIQFIKYVFGVTYSARLNGTARRGRLGIEVDHHILTQIVRQADLILVLVGSVKGGAFFFRFPGTSSLIAFKNTHLQINRH